MQWILLLGSSFVISAYLQVERGYNAIETGVIFTAATVGLLVTSLLAEQLAKTLRPADPHHRRLPRHHRRHRTVVDPGPPILVRWSPSARDSLLIGLGLGTMLTPSVNVVQSSFPEKLQGEISGLSRSVSNLGSSLGTAIAGTILVAGITTHPLARTRSRSRHSPHSGSSAWSLPYDCRDNRQIRFLDIRTVQHPQTASAATTRAITTPARAPQPAGDSDMSGDDHRR